MEEQGNNNGTAVYEVDVNSACSGNRSSDLTDHVTYDLFMVNADGDLKSRR